MQERERETEKTVQLSKTVLQQESGIDLQADIFV